MRLVCFMLLSALLFSLMACEPSHQQQKQASMAKDEEKDIIPLSAEKADGAEGWLTNSIILYTASDPTKTELFSYSIFTGKAKKLYRTDGQIVDVQINSRQQMILLQITHSHKTAVVLLNAKGETLYQKEYETYELETAWNQYDPYQMMITVFSENWDFHTYQVNAKKDDSTLSPVQVPFIHWTSKSTFDYVREGRDDKSGSLYSFDTASKTEQKLGDDVLFLDSFHQMSFTVKSASGQKGTYQFTSPQLKSPVTAELPLQTKYTSLAPMEYDYDEAKGLFYTFKKSGDAYKLAAVNVASGKAKDMFSLQEMEPIQISPNGKYALYGFHFEQIISLKTHKMKQLIIDQKEME
ncbi:YqgU-like beta propeller domain-containing protein [Bacillus vallismortis]|uniref:YqgU-like beta propeller domain-containing protein n=1 Tax=Bacillus vallismortis TaxID=72361 RepID=UPI002090AFD0|nr:hypothetical protein [Bacillus vallismortis]MCO4850148.1 hypothetical protein [Bacillus vallismortis]